MSTSGPVRAALTLAVAVAYLPAVASAQAAPGGAAPRTAVPLPPPPPGTAPIARPPAAAPPEPAVQLVGQVGYDFGFEKLVEAQMSDGSTQTLKANEGASGAMGAAFLKLAGGRLATQATIGIEYSAIKASNGSVRWLAFPLEVMEFAYLDPLRLGAGVSWLLGPSIKGNDFFEGLDLDLKNSLGLVFQADWVWRLPQNPRAGRFTAGVRFVWQKLEAKAGGPAFDANSFGLVVGFTG